MTSSYLNYIFKDYFQKNVTFPRVRRTWLRERHYLTQYIFLALKYMHSKVLELHFPWFWTFYSEIKSIFWEMFGLFYLIVVCRIHSCCCATVIYVNLYGSLLLASIIGWYIIYWYTVDRHLGWFQSLMNRLSLHFYTLFLVQINTFM